MNQKKPRRQVACITAPLEEKPHDACSLYEYNTQHKAATLIFNTELPALAPETISDYVHNYV